MKFIYKTPMQENPTLADVQENQFFVDSEGYLCQKAEQGLYNTIANPQGIPHGGRIEAAEETEIMRLLPLVERIGF